MTDYSYVHPPLPRLSALCALLGVDVTDPADAPAVVDVAGLLALLAVRRAARDDPPPGRARLHVVR